MSLHPYEIAQIHRLMTTLADVFPEERREDDFPPALETLDITFVFDHGAVCLDELNMFEYHHIDSNDTERVGILMSMSHDDVIETDDTQLTTIIEKLRDVARRVSASGDGHGVRLIKADLGVGYGTYTERLVEMIAARDWPTAGALIPSPKEPTR